jgi:hypothetical protein
MARDCGFRYSSMRAELPLDQQPFSQLASSPCIILYRGDDIPWAVEWMTCSDTGKPSSTISNSYFSTFQWEGWRSGTSPGSSQCFGPRD